MQSSDDIDPVVSANTQVAKTLIAQTKLTDLPDPLPEKLRSMFDAMEQNEAIWPRDKMARWLGFIQGVLFSHGLLNIDDERDRTRKIFHKAYLEAGIAIPASVDVEESR